ncbi:GAF domain-containing sensor histidine kinase [Gracilimonas sp.]|uniref:GAF domain-containing sensor histidine kinase n=1 Tax=Gracilimonas sp. TaxID=1974203 RepID=UPI0028712B8D|nr:ATP-binding protein [Gracilimonas sp.]
MSEIKPPIPENEFERLIKLSEYNIDYSEIRGSIDDLTKLAAHVTGTPISQVNLLDANTQWSISNYDIDAFDTPRKDTACQYVIMDDSPVEVEDMQSDERFNDKFYVIGDPNIRYYYGVPLKSDDGHRIGAMCVMDTKQNDLTPEQEQLLRIIANQVMSHIEYKHKLNLLRENLEKIKQVNRKVSHDIRGPIGGIIGISEILKEQAKENDMNDFLEFANMINNSGRSILDLANEILSEYQKNDSHKTDDQLTLPLLKQKIENLYRPQAKTKGLKFEINAEPQSGKVVFPRQRLLQILGNLITNAIKFTPDGGNITVNLSLLIKDSSILKAEIIDTGVGMSEEKIQEIFSGRAKSSEGTHNERGFGFGFQLAKHLIEEMDGQLEIESKVNEGSKITLHLPLNI